MSSIFKELQPIANIQTPGNANEDKKNYGKFGSPLQVNSTLPNGQHKDLSCFQHLLFPSTQLIRFVESKYVINQIPGAPLY